MEVADALDRISHIHAQLAKTEVYRGSRPWPILAAGVVGFAAAAAQPHVVPLGDGRGFVSYWTVVGSIAAVVSAFEIVVGYARPRSDVARRGTRIVVSQFAPALVAGAILTVAIGRTPDAIPLLPGLWAVVFALGLFALRPYAPRGTGWVALFYLCAGGLMLTGTVDDASLGGWRVGGVFGVGQLAAAFVMHRDLKRDRHAEEAAPQL